MTGDLASYRGVMLCTRPVDIPQAPKSGGLRFAAGLAPEPLGLLRENNRPIAEIAEKPPVLPALLEHKKVLRSIRQRLTADQIEREAQLKKVARRMKIVRLFCAKQREGVRDLLEKASRDQHEFASAVRGGLAAMTAPAGSAAPAGSGSGAATFVTPDCGTESGPLLEFAASLDFDKYMADMEFRTAVAVLRDRASAIEAEQTALFEALAEKINAEFQPQPEPHPQAAVEDIGPSASEVGCTARSRPQAARVATASDSQSQSQSLGVAASQVSAASLLREHREMRSVHSKESLKKVIHSALAPLLVVSDDMPQNLRGEVRPQNLPYIYRSPSI